MLVSVKAKNVIKLCAAVLMAAVVTLSIMGVVPQSKVYASMGEGRITADSLNVRNAPSKEGEAIGSVQGNEVYTILGETDGWYEINYNGTTGYIFSEYVELEVPEEIIEEEEQQEAPAVEEAEEEEVEEVEKVKRTGLTSRARTFIIMGLAVIVVILSIVMTIKSINSGEAYEDFDDLDDYEDDYYDDYNREYDERYDDGYDEEYYEEDKSSYVEQDRRREMSEPAPRRVKQGEFKLKKESKRAEINRENEDVTGYTLDIDPSIFEE